MNWLLIFILAFGSLQAMAKPSPSLTKIENKGIGVRTLHYQDASRERPVLVELWYPTQATGPLDLTEDMWIHPPEIRNADLASSDRKYPLIIMSHGHGGDRRDRSWLAESLVQKGFIVASVEHYGNARNSFHPLIGLRFWERARDVSFTLTEIMKDPALKGKVDGDRIGFIGYSLGGLTGLSLSGAKAENVKEILAQLQPGFKELTPDLLEQVDFSEAQGDFAEPRIKAFVLLSPANFVFSPQSLQQVKVPVALVATVDDEVLPHKEHALQIIKHLVPAKLKLFKNGVSHSVFVNRPVASSSAPESQILVHQEVALFTADFFQEKLSP